MRTLGLVCCALVLSAPALAQEEEDQFYILDEDAGSIKTVILSSVDGGPTNTSVVTFDVFNER